MYGPAIRNKREKVKKHVAMKLLENKKKRKEKRKQRKKQNTMNPFFLDEFILRRG